MNDSNDSFTKNERMNESEKSAPKTDIETHFCASFFDIYIYKQLAFALLSFSLAHTAAACAIVIQFAKIYTIKKLVETKNALEKTTEQNTNRTTRTIATGKKINIFDVAESCVYPSIYH